MSASITGTLSNPASNNDTAVVTLNGVEHATAAPGASAPIGCTLNAGDELKLKDGGDEPTMSGSGTLDNTGGSSTASVLRKKGRNVLETLATAAPGATASFSFSVSNEGEYITVA